MSLPTNTKRSPPMKKAKSMDSKNNDAVLAASDDPNAPALMAANLSRKKATPPQPPKKLLIKLTKASPLVVVRLHASTFPRPHLCDPCAPNYFFFFFNEWGGYLFYTFGKPTLPPNFEEDTWAKLKSAICAIFLKQPDSCDLEKLYQPCEYSSHMRSLEFYGNS
ncbi:Cullin-4, partial [Mucuna pruriens]